MKVVAFTFLKNILITCQCKKLVCESMKHFDFTYTILRTHWNTNEVQKLNDKLKTYIANIRMNYHLIQPNMPHLHSFEGNQNTIAVCLLIFFFLICVALLHFTDSQIVGCPDTCFYVYIHIRYERGQTCVWPVSGGIGKRDAASERRPQNWQT